MHPKSLTLATFVSAALGSVAVSVMAATTGVGTGDNARPVAQTQSGETTAYGRPMDDLGGALYGDLSVFDAITETGEAQAANVPYCDHRPALLATLSHDFGEHPVTQSPVDTHRHVELWASEVMGTWTAVYVRADGVACVINSGIGWTPTSDPVAMLETATEQVNS
ncbi:MAG: hypothetical protein PHX82_00430 [Paracoccaceae bacterium]|nr:hypothetical protein [Paracoccaceae bacterium]